MKEILTRFFRTCEEVTIDIHDSPVRLPTRIKLGSKTIYSFFDRYTLGVEHHFASMRPPGEEGNNPLSNIFGMLREAPVEAATNELRLILKEIGLGSKTDECYELIYRSFCPNDDFSDTTIWKPIPTSPSEDDQIIDVKGNRVGLPKRVILEAETLRKLLGDYARRYYLGVVLKGKQDQEGNEYPTVQAIQLMNRTAWDGARQELRHFLQQVSLGHQVEEVERIMSTL